MFNRLHKGENKFQFIGVFERTNGRSHRLVLIFLLLFPSREKEEEPVIKNKPLHV
jgi:hypothetical protein